MMYDHESIARALLSASLDKFLGSDGIIKCCVEATVAQKAAEMLKAQEHEISRLKHHIDCDSAEKIPSGCVGFGRGFNDDEPCETCKMCEKYNGYGEE